MKQILFICKRNDARSQMAEAFLNHLCSHSFQAHGAGLEPAEINPFVVAAMKEIGFDLSANKTQHVTRFLGQSFEYIVTLCDGATALRCPIFPGPPQYLHWTIPDPAACEGTPGERLAKAREVRDNIRMKIAAWCSANCPPAWQGFPVNNMLFDVKIIRALLLVGALQRLAAH